MRKRDRSRRLRSARHRGVHHAAAGPASPFSAALLLHDRNRAAPDRCLGSVGLAGWPPCSGSRAPFFLVSAPPPQPHRPLPPPRLELRRARPFPTALHTPNL